MDQSRDDVPVLNREVVMGSVDIGRNDGCKIASILLSISTVHGIDETLGVCISLVGGVRRTIVEHGFVDWVSRFIGEDAGGEEGDKFLDFGDAA